jgi:hypothetical protein
MNYEPIIRFRNVAEPRSFVTKWEKELSDKATRKKAFSRERDTKRGENFEDTEKYEVYQINDKDDFYVKHYHETPLESENQQNEELIKELTYDDIMFYLYFKDM